MCGMDPWLNWNGPVLYYRCSPTMLRCSRRRILICQRMDNMDNVKILLSENEIPRKWYNLAADLPTPMLPPLGPDGQPVRPEMLAPVFPMNIIEQEVSTQRWIAIPP